MALDSYKVNMKRIFFSGVCTALVTPFKKGESLEIDFPALERILDFQINSGVDALCVIGTTGEASTLSFDEKIAVVKFTTKFVKKRVHLIFGIGGNNPSEIVKLGKAVKEICPHASVMVTPPYYNKCTQQASVMYFHLIANALRMPLIVYNVPGRAGMNLEPNTLKQICQNKYIAGIKEASGNMTQIIETVRLCNVPVYCGDDALALPCYAIGCSGVISVASNVRPIETQDIWINRFNFNANKLFHNELPYYKALFCEINPSPVKYACHLLGLSSPLVRSPLTQLSKQSIIDYGFRDLFKSTRNR